MNPPTADRLLAAIDPNGDGWVSAGGPPWRDVSDGCLLELDASEWELLRTTLSESNGNEHVARKLGLTADALSERIGRLAGKLESARPHVAG